MILYIDGGCTNSNQKNPKIRQMVWIVADETGKQLVEGKAYSGSNNIAEFWALKDALEILPENEENIIYTDSRNNLAWAEGRFGKKLNDRETTWEIYKTIRENQKPYTLTWIPREQNRAGWIIEKRYGL
jgi:ribonuclease HI